MFFFIIAGKMNMMIYVIILWNEDRHDQWIYRVFLSVMYCNKNKQKKIYFNTFSYLFQSFSLCALYMDIRTYSERESPYIIENTRIRLYLLHYFSSFFISKEQYSFYRIILKKLHIFSLVFILLTWNKQNDINGVKMS